MSTRIAIVRDSIIRIVRMLTDKKVQVTQRGSSAYVTYNTDGTPKTVNIPHIPDDAAEDLLVATQGFLDHEVAHVLFTDYAAVKMANEQGFASLHNIIEDSFIERKMAVEFAGSAFNLSEMGHYFLRNYTEPRLKGRPAGDPVVEGVLIVPAIRAWAGQKVFMDFMNDGDKWKMIDKIVTRLTPLIPRVAAVANSMDAANLARDMKKLLEIPDEVVKEASGASGAGRTSGSKGKERRPGERPARRPKKTASEEPKSPGSGGAGGDEDDDEPGMGSGSGVGDEEGSAGPSVEHPEPAPGVVGEPEEDESEAEDDGLAPVAGGDDDEEEDEDDFDPDDDDAVSEGGGGSGGGGGPAGGADGPTRASGDDLYKAIEKEIAKDFDDELAKMITKSSGEDFSHRAYKIYTTDLDVIEPLKIRADFREEYLKQMLDAVDHMVGPLQKDFERAIAAKSATTWSGGHRSGRLHASALSRLSTGDDRVFRRRHINNGKDVAVALLVDCSGSMASGGKITAAAYAAYALASVLDRMNITCEVLGFTTRGRFPKEAFAEEATHGFRYARTQPLYMPILKGFGDRLNTDVKRRFASLPTCGILWENVDGESVRIAANRLATRKEARKVLFVFSDGQPACPGDYVALCKHLKSTVKEVEKAGIEVMGIGIADNSAAQYYSKHVLLTEISDLPTTVIGQIKKILMQ